MYIHGEHLVVAVLIFSVAMVWAAQIFASVFGRHLKDAATSFALYHKPGK